MRSARSFSLSPQLLSRLDKMLSQPNVRRHIRSEMAAKPMPKRAGPYDRRAHTRSHGEAISTSQMVEFVLTLGLDSLSERVASLDHGSGSTQVNAGESKDQHVKSSTRSAA